MGDKIAAKQTAKSASAFLWCLVPMAALDTLQKKPSVVSAEMGYPVLIKAASGGGGKGMQVVRSED